MKAIYILSHRLNMGKSKFYKNGHKKGSHKGSQCHNKAQPCSPALCRDCGQHFVVRSDVLGKIICKKCFRPFEKKGVKPEYEEKDVVVVPPQTLVLGFNKNRVHRDEDRYDSDADYGDKGDYDDYEDDLYPDQYAFYQSMAKDFPEDYDDD